jgi:hypothetical protein
VLRTHFSLLGDVVPPVFDEHQVAAKKTVSTRLATALHVAEQLRCSYQISPGEKREFGSGPTLGDVVLELPPNEVLGYLDDHLHKDRLLSKGLYETSQRSLRGAYGYEADEWATTTDPHNPRRINVRVAVCLAADAALAPIFRGLVDGIASRQARLRVDLFSAAFAIWAWGRDHYPALAYTLHAARTDFKGLPMGFPTCTALFRRLLGDHLDAGTEPDERADEIAAAADAMSNTTMAALANISTPGRGAGRALYVPWLVQLSAAHPAWLPDESEVDARESFARGAAPLIFDVLVGREPAAETARDLQALARSLLRTHEHEAERPHA